MKLVKRSGRFERLESEAIGNLNLIKRGVLYGGICCHRRQ